MRKEERDKKGPETLGQRVRSIRGDLTQVEFAGAVDIRQAMVSRYEADKETPSPKVLLRMSRCSGKTMEWLLTGQDMTSRGDRPAAKGAVTQEELVETASRDLILTRIPQAERFVEMMRDLFKDRRRMDKVIDFWNFTKKEE